MMRRAASGLAVLSAIGLAAATVVLADEADSRFDRVTATVAGTMKDAGVPGVALGVLAEGRRFTRGFGVTSVDNPLTVTDERLFQIGSISKTFPGTLVMQLVERGQLDLEAPVRRYLPDFAVHDAEASARLKLRDLLTHVAGFEGDLFLDTGDGDDALGRYVREIVQVEGPAKGNRGEVLRRPDGSVGWIRLGRIYRRQDAPAPRPATPAGPSS